MNNFTRRIFSSGLLLLCLAMKSSPAEAIISRDSIFKKVVENHGKGALQVDLNILFQKDSERFSLRERWTVENSEKMNVVVTSSGLQFEIDYNGNFRRPSGPFNLRSTANENIEIPLYIRSVQNLLKWTAQQHILPQAAINMQKRAPKNLRDVRPWIDPYLRITRQEGAPQYTFGVPSNPKSAGNPTLWIEQDRFQIRKIRFGSGSEVTMADDRENVKGFNFPQRRTVTWGSNRVEIQTLKITSLGSNRTPPQAKPEANSAMSLPSSFAPLVEEFYTRFR